MNRDLVSETLERVRKSNAKGLLRPVDVVDAARDPKNPLHTYFEWDDGRAAELYRREQARELIVRVELVREDAGGIRTAPMYVSLATDRMGDGGGYRRTEAVMTDSDLRREMLATALSELRALQVRYQSFTELADVFNGIEKLATRLKPRGNVKHAKAG